MQGAPAAFHSCESWGLAVNIRRIDNATPYILILPAIIVLAAVGLYPFFFSLSASFTSWYLPDPSTKKFIFLKNYADVLTDGLFWKSVRIMLVFVLTSVFFEVLLGVIIALVLDANIIGKKIFRTVLIIPMMITPAVAATLWKSMYNSSYGVITYLLNSVLQFLSLQPADFSNSPIWAMTGLIVAEVWQWTPFVVLVVLAGLQSLPRDIYEYAMTEGAREKQLLRYVTLPLIKPYIIVAVLFRIIYESRAFEIIYLVNQGGPGNSTEHLPLHIFYTGLSWFRFGRACSMSFILMIATLLFVFLFAKKIIRL